MKTIRYIILLLLMPLALGAQSISPTCRTCGKKIALCPYKGKHPKKQSPARQQHSSRPSGRPSAPHGSYGNTASQGSSSQSSSLQQPTTQSRQYVTDRRFDNGTEYRSEWKDDKQEGWAMLVIDGGILIGKFAGDKLDGHGLVIQKDGTPVYKRWKDDECVEELPLTATSRPDTYSYNYTYDDGTYVEGNIKNGKGLCKFPGGAVYEGEWKDSNPHGFGIYRYKNGDIYVGELNEGKKDGTGIYFYKSTNDAYAGEWRNDKKCYNGTYFWYRSGNAYVGQWSGDNMSGFGTMYYRNSKCSRGRWENDNLVEAL